MSEPVSNFIGAMEAAGMKPLEPIAPALSSGELIRFRCEGDRKKRNGWARMYLDGAPAGAFGHWRLGITSSWREHDGGRALSPAELRRLKAEARQAQIKACREQRDRQAKAAIEACALWDSGELADAAHPYLSGKRLSPVGIRQSGQELLVPMLDRRWHVRNVQRIKRDGFKLFLKGGRTAGLFWPHGLIAKDGSATDGPVVIAEGFGTASAIWQNGPQCGVVAALSAKNLKSVAAIMQSLFPDRQIIIAADDDCHLSDNTGLNTARMAAQAVGGLLATPQDVSLTERSQADFGDIPPSTVKARIEAAQPVVGGANG